MEYKEHSPVSQDVQMQLVNAYKGTKAAEQFGVPVEAFAVILSGRENGGASCSDLLFLFLQHLQAYCDDFLGHKFDLQQSMNFEKHK